MARWVQTIDDILIDWEKVIKVEVIDRYSSTRQEISRSQIEITLCDGSSSLLIELECDLYLDTDDPSEENMEKVGEYSALALNLIINFLSRPTFEKEIIFYNELMDYIEDEMEKWTE